MTRAAADSNRSHSPCLFVGTLVLAGALASIDISASMPATFRPAVTYSTGGIDTIFPSTGGPVWVLAADVNGDNQLDLLVANWCGRVSACASSNVGVLINNGQGTFRPVVIYETGGVHALSVAAADMNGDGIPDVIVANGCGDSVLQPGAVCSDGSAGVLLGNGDGTFQKARVFPSGGSMSALVVADLNHDGHPDVVVSNCAPNGQFCPAGNGNVGVLLGNGDGSLQPVTIYDSGGLAATFVAVVDVNGDHAPDVLVSNQRTCDNCRGTLGVLLARGDGTFQTVHTYDTGLFAPAFIATADLNGDQHADVVLTQNVGGGGELAVLLNRGDGTFQAAAVYETGGLYATPLVVVDTNGDGTPDMVVSHSQFCTGRSPGLSCIGVLLGNGDGSFQPAVTYQSGGTGAWSLTAADFNGDGNIDVAVAHQCRPLTCQGATAIVGVLDGNGDGSFQPPVIYDTAAPSVLAVAADVNGDGKPDLLIGSAPPGTTGTISVLLNSSSSAQGAIPATADAYVRAGSFSAQKVGAAHTLLAKKGVADDNTRRSYLTFDISAIGDGDHVTLRLYGRLSSAASHNLVTTVYAVPDVTWDESRVTWNSRPNLGKVLGSMVVEGTAPQWVNLDLTTFVRSEQRAGHQMISVALRNVTHSSAISIFNSREATQGAPALIIVPVVVNPHVTVSPTSGTRPVSFNMRGTGLTQAAPRMHSH